MVPRADKSLAWLLFVFPVLLCGCPYESDVPLSGCGEAGLDSALIGKWEYLGSPGDRESTIEFVRFNERELLVLVREEGNARIDMYRACVSPVGDERFLNVQDLTVADQRKWSFVQYSVVENRLTVRIVDEKLFQKPMGSPEELHRFIRENLANPALYDDEKGQVLKRVKE
jgi:hypothetical protein